MHQCCAAASSRFSYRTNPVDGERRPPAGEESSLTGRGIRSGAHSGNVPRCNCAQCVDVRLARERTDAAARRIGLP
ncbi:hypothetical protein GCM10027024_15550 [Microbacterium insulae]